MKSKAKMKIPALVGVMALAMALPARVAHAAAAATVKFCEWEKLTEEDLKEKPDKPQRFPNLTCKIGTGATGLKASDFQLKTDGEPPAMITGTKVTAFKDSNEQLDIFVLVQGSVRFMGDPTPDPQPGEDPGEIKGYFNEVKQAIDVIAKTRTKNTNVGIWVYGDKVFERAPMSPAGNITGESLGAQKDYSRITTKAFKLGLGFAQTTLSNASGRRVLFVIGDGDDQNDNVTITDEITKLENSGIEVYILGANPRGPLDARAQTRLTKLGKLGDFQSAQQAEQIPQIAESLANEINNVYTVEFPGSVADGTVLPFDGSEHDITIVAKKDESEAKSIKFPLIKKKEIVVEETSYTWLWVLLGLVAVLAPMGQLFASALLPAAGAPASSLRRLDSLLLAAPVWCVGVGLVL